MTKSVTTRQREVYEFIVARIEQDGRAPFHKEIQQHFGWASPYAVVSHLNALEKKRLIRRDSKSPRNIEVIRLCST